MAEQLRRRIEELKSRKAATDDAAASPQPASTSASAATAVTQRTSSPQLSSAAAMKPAASLPIAKLPPPFVSPYGAVVKYRDPVEDPLCARFTTRHAVKLLEAMLQSQDGGKPERQKRSRSPDDSNDVDLPTKRHHCDDDDDHQPAGNMSDSEMEKKNKPKTSHCFSTIVSHFLPDIAARCFTNSEGTGKEGEEEEKEKEKKEEGECANTCTRPRCRDVIHNNNGGGAGCILVSGKRRVSCRSVNEYVPKARIAHGVYGVVFSATMTSSAVSNKGQNATRRGERYALKQVKRQWLAESQVGFPPYLLREFDLLLRLRHPNIVRAREVVLLDKKLEATRQSRGRGGATGMKTITTAECLSTSSSKSCGDRSHEKCPHEAKGVAPCSYTTTINSKKDINNNDNNNNNKKNNNNGLSEKDKAAADGTQLRQRGPDNVKDVYLVMDYCPYDLKSFLYLHNDKGVCLHLSSRNKHPDARRSFLSRVKCIMQQLFRALSFLHDHRILHRDIKTSNILISHQGIVKLCDFGLGRLYCEGQELTANVVTLMYRAPELHFGVRDYSHKMDVWSMGCIMAELFLKEPLFRAEEEIRHFAAVCDVLGIPTEETFSGLYKMPELTRMMRSLTRYNRENTLRSVFEKCRHAGASTLPDSGLDLLQRIFRWNPIDRISAHEALNHPFFSEEPLPCSPAELLRSMPTSEAPSRRPDGISGDESGTASKIGEIQEGECTKTPPPVAQLSQEEDKGALRAVEKPPAVSLPVVTVVGNLASTANGNKADMMVATGAGSSSSGADEEEDDTEHALLRELDSLREEPTPRNGDEAQCMANRARLRAHQSRDTESSPECR